MKQVKKTLLASAITLTYLGFATSSALAEENQAQTTSAETTQQTTTANKVETKEPVPSTEASSSIPTTSTTNPSKTSAKKEESKAPEVKKEGWVFEGNIWRFYEANKAAINWKKINGKWYYFDKDGIMLSDTIYDGYILTSSGAMAERAWVKQYGKWKYDKYSCRLI